ncbi:hypothetical protein AAFC00_004054 [Neodothiora populina]|uniref:Inactive metallocarboxypeptidase ECM14 n=1 Tax=Neodothiora populina TaxID=2781224 RepID=A0ABR3PID7_9PEZI
MRPPSLSSLTVSALCATSVIAIPFVDSHDSALSSQTRAQPLPQDVHPHRPLWRSISDPIIRKVWGLASPDIPSSTPRLGKGQTGQKDASAQLARHGDEIVLRFNITGGAESAALSEAADTLFLDVWEFTEDWVDIRLAKDIVPSLLALLPASLQRSHKPLMQERELAQAIANTYPSPPSGRGGLADGRHNRYHAFGPALGPQESEGNLFFSDYQPLSVIQPWMRLMASLFTTHVRLINIGLSYEGRDINALRVGVHPTNDEAPTTRKTILVTGGVHAREWISTSTVNYIAYSLITGYGKDPYITSLLQEFDWVFVPTFNPDGYVYSWETDRLWRKNRQQTHLRFCRGLDLDRSFAFQWDGESTHTNPCSESFAGESPFDGVESKRLADWARNETENNHVEFVGFLDLHSYSQEILYPYSYSCETDPPSLENLQELAAGLAKSIRQAGGHYYQSAPACEGNVALAAASSTTKDNNDKQGRIFPRFESGGGSALDWFYHEMKVKYTYQFKLRDRGTYGFLLPSEHIVPTGKEMLDAFLHFGGYLAGQLDVSGKSISSMGKADESAVAENTTEDKNDLDVHEVDASSEEDEEDEEEEQETNDDDDDDDELLDPYGTMWELRRGKRL